MISATKRGDLSRLRLRLELLGIDMERQDGVRATTHGLLMPMGLRFGDDYAVDWDAIQLVQRDPATTRQCLWDVLKLYPDKEVLYEDYEDDVLIFVRKWGLIDFGEDAYLHFDEPGGSSLIEWMRFARDVRGFLETLVATDDETLVDEEILDTFNLVDPARPGLRPEWLGRPLPEILALQGEEQRRLWRNERAQGRGLIRQRTLLVERLREWSLPADFRIGWDERGRYAEAVAYGAREIVVGHLRSLFVAAQLNIYLCSVCGQPYPLAPDTGQRRPRHDRRRFCGEACRESARRESNLAAWHRHKEKWRASHES